MLKVLYFSPKYIRDINRENIERLKEIFKEEGCLRQELLERYMLIIINIRELNWAIKCNNGDITLDTLLDNLKELPPLLKFPPNMCIKYFNSKYYI